MADAQGFDSGTESGPDGPADPNLVHQVNQVLDPLDNPANVFTRPPPKTVNLNLPHATTTTSPATTGMSTETVVGLTVSALGLAGLGWWWWKYKHKP